MTTFLQQLQSLSVTNQMSLFPLFNEGQGSCLEQTQYGSHFVLQCNSPTKLLDCWEWMILGYKTKFEISVLITCKTGPVAKLLSW